MTKKQQKLLQLLTEIDEICTKHHLRYVMAGGSLIGVVRHEGFVPWDDDIDIYMPRDDWDAFTKLVKTEFPPDRNVQCLDLDRRFTNTFPRYVDTSSCAVHRHQLIGDDEAGEIIDVLTLDPQPDDQKGYEKYRHDLMIYSELANPSLVYGVRWEIPSGDYLKYLIHSKIFGRRKTYEKLEKKLFSYPEEAAGRYAMRWGGSPFLFDKDMFFPAKRMKFENIEVSVPNRISDYLIWHYGDEWSYIPPHDERTSHEAISIENYSYKDFRAQYQPEIPVKELEANSEKLKIKALRWAPMRNRLNKEKNELQASFTGLELEKVIKENHYDIPGLVKDRNFRLLNTIFAQYFLMQNSAEFIGREEFMSIYPFHHPVLIPVSDENFHAAMMTLFYTERIGKASRMIQVRAALDHDTPQMKALAADIQAFRGLLAEYERGETDSAFGKACELYRKYPAHPGFLKFLVRTEAALCDDHKYLDEAMSLFPEDGFFIKYQADRICREEGLSPSLPLYAKARENTKNGMIYLEIDKKFQGLKKDLLETFSRLLSEGKKEDAKDLLLGLCAVLPGDTALSMMKYHPGIRSYRNAEEVLRTCREMIAGTCLEENSGEAFLEETCRTYLEISSFMWKSIGCSGELSRIAAKLPLAFEYFDYTALKEALSAVSLMQDENAMYVKEHLLYLMGKTVS